MTDYDTDHLSGVIEGADVAARQTKRGDAVQLARGILEDLNASRFSSSMQQIEAAQEKAAKLIAYLEGEAE